MDTNDGESKFASFSLYHHMCKHVVGTEKHVRTIRLVNTVFNNLSYNIKYATITSGSFGEGLRMIGSDLDIMINTKILNVLDETEFVVINPMKTYFSLMTEDTKPGFVMLRLIRSNYPGIRYVCEQFRMEYYLSNALYKKVFLADFVPVEHGPCLSNREGTIDIAYCLHGMFWVKSASKWIMRSNNVWPDKYTKQTIINHGVLFVPIGSKGSLHEELEWRVSFSVGEKFLIYTFSHTQILCYALMKILLKDVINSDSRCEGLICSYYLKTILFWISEESHPSVWTPENLIHCFMKCFRRLIYFVQYSICPHYFIPENNLFEDKIEGLNKDYLVDTLRLLLSYDWRCIIFSKQMSDFMYVPCKFEWDQSCLYYEDINKFFKTLQMLPVSIVRYDKNSFSRTVNNIISYNSKNLKYIHTHFMSLVCNTQGQAEYFPSTTSNKAQYKVYNTRLNNLLMNINQDTVSGWLMLASFFYKANQYKKSLVIIMYALSKCTPEKIFNEPNLSVTQRQLIKWSSLHKHGVVRLFKFVKVGCVSFQNSTLIPNELLIKECVSCKIPPVVYAHFLSFLCHYHLKNERECRHSFRDLQLTISEDYFIGIDIYLNAFSYYCLGTALQLMGDNVLAKHAFTQTAELLGSYQFVRKSLTRLSMTASF